ncbi:MAG TPA: hypothetical protein VFZ48_05050 [Candidatus Saccharimonadales bacterium]
MIVGLKTDSPTCELTFVYENGERYAHAWKADRELAKGLLSYIEQQLETQAKDWDDIKGLVVFKGPGSFTGLRIGITVMNAIAYASDLPIVGGDGKDWLEHGVERLQKGDNDKIVLPEYGAEPHITKPRK